MNKTNGGVGTNQYRIRGTPRQSDHSPVRLGATAKDALTVARTPKTAPRLLMALSTHPDYDVRYALASNPNCPSGALTVLARGEQTDLVLKAIEHPHCSADTLDEIVGPLWRCSSPPLSFLPAIGKHPNTSYHTLYRMACSDPPAARYCVAVRPQCPIDLLEYLSADPDTQVRQAVASNSNTALETLIRLVQSDDIEVRRTATNNPSLPEHIRSVVTLGR